MANEIVNRMDTTTASPRLAQVAARQRGRSLRDVLVVVLCLSGALGGLFGLVSL